MYGAKLWDCREAVDVRVHAVHKRFKNSVVLEGLSLWVAPGSFAVLRGENGSGKTTLLRIMAGLLAPDSGQVQYGNRPASRALIGYVPQVLAPVPYLTGRDILAAAATLYRVPRLQVQGRIEWLVQLCGLRQVEECTSVYSGGMLKRLAVAVALINAPEVLLLDEALDALDFEMAEQLMRWLQNMCQQKRMTVVLVTHRHEPYASVADTWLSVEAGTCRVEQGRASDRCGLAVVKAG